MADRDFKDLDVVELATEPGRWPEGTVGAIVDVYDDDAAMVEICDAQGRTLDLLGVPCSGLRHARGATKSLPA